MGRLDLELLTRLAQADDRLCEGCLMLCCVLHTEVFLTLLEGVSRRDLLLCLVLDGSRMGCTLPGRVESCWKPPWL